MIRLEQKTPPEIQADIAQRVRRRRREFGYSQAELAKRSGVSLGSIKRFETIHEISLASLVRIAIALRCLEDFDSLFARKHYDSIDEVIADAERS